MANSSAKIPLRSDTETMQELTEQNLLSYLRSIRNVRFRKLVPLVSRDGLRVRMKLVDLEGKASSEWSPWLEPGDVLNEDKHRLDRAIVDCLQQLNGGEKSILNRPIYAD